jgi:hypothetical protein
MSQPKTSSKSKSSKSDPSKTSKSSKSDPSKVHKLALKGSSKVVNEFVSSSAIAYHPALTSLVRVLHQHHSVRTISSIFIVQPADSRRFQRGVYPAEDFTA